MYQALDRDGIDAMLSERRDMTGPKAFFRSTKATLGFLLDRVPASRQIQPECYE